MLKLSSENRRNEGQQAWGFFVVWGFFLSSCKSCSCSPRCKSSFFKPFLHSPSILLWMCPAFPELVFKLLDMVFLSPVFILMHQTSSEIVFTHIAQILRCRNGLRLAVPLGGGMCLPVFGDLRHFSCLLP